MALPGLQLSAPTARVESAPTVHELRAGSEWRFEVAFGEQVVVKVSEAMVTAIAAKPALKTSPS